MTDKEKELCELLEAPGSEKVRELTEALKKSWRDGKPIDPELLARLREAVQGGRRNALLLVLRQEPARSQEACCWPIRVHLRQCTLAFVEIMWGEEAKTLLEQRLTLEK